ncbi:MAG: Tfp pilus assembly protein PilX [Kiritimatiellia bacterium]|jgi:Tfp pilus assembly protein PilX
MKGRKRFAHAASRGYVLGLVLVVVVVFSLVLIAIVSSNDAAARDAGKQANRLQVNWAADAAVKQVVRRLEVDSSFRKNPYVVNGQLNHVDFSVMVAGGPTIYKVQATSDSGQWQHKASQAITLPASLAAG